MGLTAARGFGFDVVAGRTRAGADAEETMAARAEEVGGVVDEEEDVLVDVLVEVLGAAARATGAGSGRSLDGDLTGARSGPDP